MGKRTWITIAIICVVATALGFGLGFGLRDDNEESENEEIDISGDFLLRRTEYGIIRGLVYDPEDELSFGQLGPIDSNGSHDSAMFLGVPYAAPPVGNNRFRSPKDPESWTGIKNTFVKPLACAQKCPEPCPVMAEDCLYLNIFVPRDALETNRQVPVFVWYHGGSFAWGSGSSFLYDGRYSAPSMDAIVVTVNYRLTAFGFLQLPYVEEGEETNANWGFLDQKKALKWVYDNIHNFNGDKYRITVAGQSAGAISATLLYLHKESSRMMKNVIIQSNPYAIGLKENWETALQTAYFSEATGCKNADPACLRERSMEEIIQAVADTPQLINNEHLFQAALPFSPVIDDVNFFEQPYFSLRDGDYSAHVNVMTGFAQHESEMFVQSVMQRPVGGAVYNASWRILLRNRTISDQVIERYPAKCRADGGLTGDDLTAAKKNCKDSITDLFPNGPSISQKLVIDRICSNSKNCFYSSNTVDDRDTLELPSTEWLFSCPMIEWLDFAKDRSKPNTWAYQFRTAMAIDISKAHGPVWKLYEKCYDLSCHAAELSYQFQVENMFNCSAVDQLRPGMVQCETNGELLTEEELEVERHLIRYFANFIHNSDPNDSRNTHYPPNMTPTELAEWDNFSKSSGVMHIGYNYQTPEDDKKPSLFEPGYKHEECEFWNSLDVYANH